MDTFDFLQPPSRSVRYDDLRWPVSATLLLHEMPGQRDGRAARAHRKDFRAGIRKVIGRQEIIERKTRRDRILSMTDEFSILLRETASLAHNPRGRINDIKDSLTGRVQIDLVRGDQRAKRQRIELEEFDRFSIRFGRRVRLKVDALHFHITETEMLRPPGEHSHDRALPGRHTDEVKRGPRGGLISRHRETPSAANTPRASKASTSCSVRAL